MLDGYIKAVHVGAEAADPLRLMQPSWMTDAECTRAAPELFYKPPGRAPGRNGDAGDTIEQARIADAKSFCEMCPVRQECLEYALKINDEWAIMGGMTADERRRMKRRNSATARPEAAG